jgi:hypothetical protein
MSGSPMAVAMACVEPTLRRCLQHLIAQSSANFWARSLQVLQREAWPVAG